jgi:NAD(P)-dependent dehydrogenase (short-subunit alcohol dehydrogenase family)
MKITIFGGTGGLGSQILQNTMHVDIDRVGSKKCNFNDLKNIEEYFNKNKPEIVLFFNALNINGFLHKLTPEQINQHLDANIKGVAYATSLALKYMRNNDYGRLIYASSVTVENNVIGTSLYAASKAYYENLVKNVALENASRHITANCIQLGYMDGGLTYTLPKELLEQKLQEIPAKRLGTISEIDKTIKFLTENEYVNGSVIKLTGGL